jgi:hypothetical protein
MVGKPLGKDILGRPEKERLQKYEGHGGGEKGVWRCQLDATVSVSHPVVSTITTHLDNVKEFHTHEERVTLSEFNQNYQTPTHTMEDGRQNKCIQGCGGKTWGKETTCMTQA